MMESPTVPRHLVASEGRIYAKSEGGLSNYVPKQIDYRHTIRIITPFECSHGDEMQRIRAEKDAMAREKEKEIEQLQVLLRQKEEELQRKDGEIERLKESKRQYPQNSLKLSVLESKLQRSQVTDIFASNVKSHRGDHCLSNIKTSYIFDLSSTEYQQSKGIGGMEEELQSMENNLKQLADALSKPKPPYQFFTRAKDRLATLPPKIEKLQAKIDLNACELAQQEGLDEEAGADEEESVECTSTNESFDATDFLQDAIQEHKVLMDTLIELERSTKAEMNQMKQFYENQIEGYKRMLQKQRDKTRAIDSIRMQGEQKRQYIIRQQQFCNLLGGAMGNFQNVNTLLDND